MKDYVKINKANDWKRVEQEINNIKVSQEQGIYPFSYEYPLSLQFELTSKCNVKCKHCYNKSGDDNSVTDAMTIEEWKLFSRYLVSKCGLFQCVISGGEPLLLGDDLFDIMDILHDDGTSFLVITNGYLLDKKRLKSLRNTDISGFKYLLMVLRRKFMTNSDRKKAVGKRQ